MELRAAGISRRFFRETKGSNYFYALKKLDFVLKEGALTVIMGRSGSGKSTLLSILGGILTPSEGKVFLDGKDFYSLSDQEASALRNKHIGIVPQTSAFLSSLSAYENVLMPGKLYGLTINEERVKGLLERLGVLSLSKAYPKELSGGELRRFAIARALLTCPEILLADEPTGDLDDENTSVVLNLFKEYAGEGKSVLLVTHEKEAAAYADALYEMKEGALSVGG